MAFPLFRAELPASLSAEESAELSARMAALAKSGLPLEGGLYALAAEVAQPRLAGVLCNMVTRLEAGEKLETAIAAQGSRLPAHLRGLIVAGVRSGRLPIVLDEFAAITRRQRDIRRRVILALAYPAILLGIMAALTVFCHLVLAGPFAEIFKDFGVALPAITTLYIRCSGAVAWTALGLVVMAVAVPLLAGILPMGAWLGRLTLCVPVLGGIVRSNRHAHFSHLMALLLEEQVPLPEALSLTSIGLQGTSLERQSRAAAAAVAEGMPLDQALAGARFPDSLTAMVAWGQQKNCLSKAFRAAAEMFEARTNSQGALLNMVVLPIIYMMIITFVAVTVLALMMPLVSLISSLSGWGPSSYRFRPPPTAEEKIVEGLMIGSAPVFVLGVVLLMLVRWWNGPSPGARDGAFGTLTRVFGWLLTIVGFVVGCGMVFPGLPIIWFVSLAVIISMAYGKHVATQQYALLALVGAAAERSIPLETAFAAFGHERGGWMRQRTAEIVHMLYHGASLPAALEAVPGVLPPETVPLVCVGYENGSLGPAVAQAISARNIYEPIWQTIVPKLGYICILPAVAFGIVAFIMLKIVPQFEKIFKDFNTRLPPVTRGLIAVCRWDFFWLVLGLFWLLSVALLVYVVLRYAGSIRWNLPGMDWLLRRRHWATVLDALALAAGRQRPLGEALANLAESYPQLPIRRRLQAVCDELQSGGDDFQCLNRHGLLNDTDMALLQAAQRNGNLAWAAGELADSNRRRFIYRTHALLQVIFPVIIIVYGVWMAIVSIAMITPMADLIWRLSPT